MPGLGGMVKSPERDVGRKSALGCSPASTFRCRTPPPRSRRVHVEPRSPPACGPPRRAHRGTPGTTAPGAGGARRPSRPQSACGPPRGPAGGASAARPCTPPPTALSGCTGAQAAPTTNGCRQPVRVTPLCLSGAQAPAGPASRGQGQRVAAGEPLRTAAAGGEAGEPGKGPAGDGSRPEKRWRPFCGGYHPPPPQAAGAGARQVSVQGNRAYRLLFLLHSGEHLRHGPVYRGVIRAGQTDPHSGNRQRLQGVRRRARNDSLLSQAGADTSPLWGNGPASRDHGEPGGSVPTHHRCRGLEGGAQGPGPGLRPPGGGKAETLRSSPQLFSPQYAMANIAVPFPLCALQPAHSPLHRRAGTRRGAQARAGMARSARPASPGTGPAPRAGGSAPTRGRGPDRPGLGGARGTRTRGHGRPPPSRPPSRARSAANGLTRARVQQKLQHTPSTQR